MPLTIKEMPESERPYEKLKLYGAEVLSDAELLAIIIKTGTKEENSVEIANRILLLSKGLNNFYNISLQEFKNIKGIGDIKAIQLKALSELTKRMLKKQINVDYRIKSTKDVYDYLINEYKFEKQEIIKVLILNSKNVVEKNVEIVKGDSNFAMVSPKQVLAEAVRMQAPRIIMVHNHPSGDSKPSMQDVEITKRVIKAAEILGIEVLDHVVIGDNSYESVMSLI